MIRSKPEERETPLLPESDAREVALLFVVAALCFLAALVALSARASYGAAAEWTTAASGELTVRLRGVDTRAAGDAETLIAALDGVETARLITREEAAQMLAPWFGTDGLPAGLPVPVLVEVKARNGVTDLASSLATALDAAGFEALIDDHAKWGADVRRALGAARFAAFAAVALLVATAIAVIAFATHAALLARRDIVNVLHLSGAPDPFIANLFERRFWLLGLRGGVLGAIAALGVAAFLVFAVGANAERTWLLPRLSLDFWDFVILLLTPIIAGFSARIAARRTVIKELARTI
ncbi:MAG: cell division protein FtsX [Hyphomonadaceae bacterium]